MPWEDLDQDIAELFGDFDTFSPKADGLSVIRRREPKDRKPGKTPEEMRAYKAAKAREYKERDKQLPPTETTKEILRRKALERKLMRERMQPTRSGFTHHFTIIAKTPDENGTREIDGYLTLNTYEDGRLGEIFIRIGKSGAEEAIYEQWAVGASVAIQFGVPVEAYFRKFLGTRFEPAGATMNKEIPRCTSILDYVSRFILLRFCKPKEEPALVSVPANADGGSK